MIIVYHAATNCIEITSIHDQQELATTKYNIEMRHHTKYQTQRKHNQGHD